MTNQTRRNKILGALLGLHVGDALGATLEFKRPGRLEVPHSEIIGGGSLQWEPGAATDDTDLMICILKSIKSKNDYSLDIFVHELLNWFNNNPKDVGNTTYRAIKNILEGSSYSLSGINEEEAQGNGSLMRCAPLAFLDFNEAEIAALLKKYASVTHAHPRCHIADEILIFGIRSAFFETSKNQILTKITEFTKQRDNALYNKMLQIPKTEWQELNSTGFIDDTLITAIWGLYHGRSFEDALIKVVNRGGDADTIGAVTGALCGVFFGLNNIPERWLNVIKNKKEIETLANKLI